jgi:hypothetical protein
MKAKLESTSKVVNLAPSPNSHTIPARIWEGVTESGIPFTAFVTRVMVARDQDNRQFETELEETKVSSALVAALPLRLIL